MTWVMVGSAAVTVVGGAIASNQQKKGAQGAANAAAAGSAAEIAERQRQYDLTRQDQQPWMQAGTNALGQMQALNSGDFSSFKESPDYKFAFDQGLQGLDRGAAARGGLYSGGHTADTIKYGQGMAAQQYGNFYSRLQSLAGQGQTVAGGLGAMGMGMAGQNANSIGNAANARASSYLTRADANGQFATGVAGVFNNGLNQWGAQRSSQATAAYAPPSNQYASGFGNNTGWLNGGAG